MIVSPAEVRAWGELQASDTMLNIVIGAVDTHMRANYVVPDPPPADAKLAALMQTSRLLRRRKTPEGVAVFGSDVAIRVSRFDPDIASMLVDYAPAKLGEG